MKHGCCHGVNIHLNLSHTNLFSNPSYSNLGTYIIKVTDSYAKIKT